MKIRCLGFCFFIVLVSATGVRADGLPPDPVITMEGGTGSIILNTLNDPAFTFTFTQPTTGTPGGFIFISFINNTGFRIGQVNTVYTDNRTLSFSCVAGNIYFNNCSPQTATSLSPGGNLLVSFFGLDSMHPGIPTAGGVTCNERCFANNPLADFQYKINVTDVPTGGSFTFTGTLIAVPEPSTIALLLSAGALGLLFKRSKTLSFLQ